MLQKEKRRSRVLCDTVVPQAPYRENEDSLDRVSCRSTRRMRLVPSLPCPFFLAVLLSTRANEQISPTDPFCEFIITNAEESGV